MAKLTEKARLLAHRLPAGRGIPASDTRARRPAYIPVKAVGTFVPRLTQKAFEKYGFSAATLLTDWAAIVGPALARDTRPERLKWPRAVEAYDEIDERDGGRPGATLILKVDPARALDIEYKRSQILDRINGYFGYRAVAQIKLVQEGAFAGQPAMAVADRPAPASTGAKPDLAAVSDDRLRAALERLYAGVSARASAR